MPLQHTRDRRRSGWYHLFSQGYRLDGERPRKVFIDREDKRKFLSLLARHLGQQPHVDGRGRPYLHMRAWIVVVAFCVMTTHFHMIVRQRDGRGIELLMGRVKAEYARYFNAMYGNRAPLFNGPVRAKQIDSRGYYRWLVGYVHKNWSGDESYEFSSHSAWVNDEQRPGWLDAGVGLDAFGGIDPYRAYLPRFDAKRAIDVELEHRGRRR